MDNLELSNYQGIKQNIKTELNHVAESFVIIGFNLKQIRDKELYKHDGYSNIYEFAKTEYSLERTTALRLMAINDKYSLNGSSPKLIEQYEGYGYSKLSEMLTLSEDDLQLITVQTTRAEIRDIKQTKYEAEKEICAPAHNPQSLENTQSEGNFEEVKKLTIPDADKMLIDFFRDKSRRGYLKRLAEVITPIVSHEALAMAAEIISPSGYLLFKYKLAFFTFEEKIIKYSMFKQPVVEFTYFDLIHDILQTFDMTSADPALDFYGEPEPEPLPEPEPPKKETPKAPEKKIESKPFANKPSKPVVTQSDPEDEDEDLEDNEDQEGDEEEETDTEDSIPGQAFIDDYPEVIPEPNEKLTEIVIENNETTSIDDLDLSVNTYNCLKRAGIDTIEKLCELQFQDIVCIRNIGKSNIDEIKEKLKPLGLSLNLDDERVEVIEADIIITGKVQADNTVNYEGLNAIGGTDNLEEVIRWYPISEKPESNRYVLLAIQHNQVPDVIMGFFNMASGFRDDIYQGKGCTYLYWTYKPKSPLGLW